MEEKKNKYRLRVVEKKKKFDYIGFNMRNQTHDPEINDTEHEEWGGESGKKAANANDTIANICLTNKIFRTASHKQSLCLINVSRLWNQNVYHVNTQAWTIKIARTWKNAAFNEWIERERESETRTQFSPNAE